MSKKIPRVAAEPVKMKEKKRPRFGRLPERGVIDKRLWRTRHGMHVRVLYACAIHADAAGFFCISQDTVAKLVGLRHGASAYSYLRDLEDWGYLRRIKTIPHPDRKFVKKRREGTSPSRFKAPLPRGPHHSPGRHPARRGRGRQRGKDTGGESDR